MSQFMYLYRGGEVAGTPEHMQQQMQKWLAWMEELATKGHIRAGGDPLEPTGKVVRKKTQITDGPYAEKDLVGGYTIIEANDLNEAASIASGCPHFDAGGFVEVRPIMKM